MKNRIRAISHLRYPFDPHPSDFISGGVNFSQYVDFSTAPTNISPEHRPFIISDVSNTVTRFSLMNHMVEFYQRFPLHEMIAMLLSVSLKDDNVPRQDEYLLFQTETRLGTFLDEVDIEELIEFYDLLTMELDMELAAKSPSYATLCNYIFYRWIDPISICMCRETFVPYTQKVIHDKTRHVITRKPIHVRGY